MALTTEEAAVNTAADAYIAALEAMYDAVSQGVTKMFVPIRMKQVGQPHERWANDGATLQWDFGSREIVTREITTADRFPVSIGEHPIVWKVTNAAGDLT